MGSKGGGGEGGVLDELEEKCNNIYQELTTTFERIAKAKDQNKASALLKGATSKMHEAKRLIKEFEAEARAQGLAASVLNQRKNALVRELNAFVAKKKEFADREKLVMMPNGSNGADGASPSSSNANANAAKTMSMEELMLHGNKKMDESDAALERSKAVVENTMKVGAATAETLQAQSKQMERVSDDLDAIQFSLKKSAGLIRDMTRQLATDRCIALMLVLVVCAVVALIVVKIVNPKNKNIANLPGIRYDPSPPPPGGRRLLLQLMAPDADDMW
eukprot:jgi/Chlat1/5010/Chrsp32S08950